MRTEIAIVYCSRTENTKELAILIGTFLANRNIPYHLFHIEKLPSDFAISDYKAILIGTYSWGKGEIPKEMHSIYEKFESEDVRSITTGVFGTGDCFYPNFCGAVDHFRDMLFVHSNLAVTLKVELAPQKSDEHKCRVFVEKILAKL